MRTFFKLATAIALTLAVSGCTSKSTIEKTSPCACYDFILVASK